MAFFSGGTALYDGIGHKYSEQRSRYEHDRKTGHVLAKVTRWRCTFRTANCNGSVASREDPPGCANPTHVVLNNHVCTPQPGIEVKDALYAKAKKIGMEQSAKPALEIVEPLLVEYHDQHPTARVPLPTNIERVVNRKRTGKRPTVPKDLDFELELLNLGFPEGIYR